MQDAALTMHTPAGVGWDWLRLGEKLDSARLLAWLSLLSGASSGLAGMGLGSGGAVLGRLAARWGCSLTCGASGQLASAISRALASCSAPARPSRALFGRRSRVSQRSRHRGHLAGAERSWNSMLLRMQPAQTAQQLHFQSLCTDCRPSARNTAGSSCSVQAALWGTQLWPQGRLSGAS